jgi:poly(3-hydroxyalkanoate) synthetase
VLFIPAWIRTYYILDLSPQNSMFRYLLQQGRTVFMVSWRNPGADNAEWLLEYCLKSGVTSAIDAINIIVRGARLHANGCCLGGTSLAIAAAVMACDDVDRLASVTLMAAQVDFAEAGELLLFADESQLAFVDDLMWLQGYLDQPQMTRTFASIRAEDLIYSRAVNRYFLGNDDLPTDIGVWNGDTTRMPTPMHSEYLRGLLLENRLSAGRFAVEGRVIALKDIAVPTIPAVSLASRVMQTGIVRSVTATLARFTWGRMRGWRSTIPYRDHGGQNGRHGLPINLGGGAFAPSWCPWHRLRSDWRGTGDVCARRLTAAGGWRDHNQPLSMIGPDHKPMASRGLTDLLTTDVFR